MWLNDINEQEAMKRFRKAIGEMDPMMEVELSESIVVDAMKKRTNPLKALADALQSHGSRSPN